MRKFLSKRPSVFWTLAAVIAALGLSTPGAGLAHMGETGPGHHDDDPVAAAEGRTDGGIGKAGDEPPTPPSASPASGGEAVRSEGQEGGIQAVHLVILGVVLMAGLGLLVVRKKREGQA